MMAARRGEGRYGAYLLLSLSYVLTGFFFYLCYLLLEPHIEIPVTEVVIETALTQEPVRLRPLLWYMFVAFSAMTFLNELTYIPLGLYHQRLCRSRRTAFSTQLKPMVSIIVPAYNEEKVIEESLQALFEVSYPNREIIVVNDGSTDRTEQMVKPYALKGRLSLINLPHGGKTFAMNAALKAARGDLIVVVDADSHLERKAISYAVPHFEDPSVVAVAGNVRIGNRVTLLTQLQALEYVRGINLRKRAFDLLNCVDVVPGAAGIFRKNALTSVGAYDMDTATEDMDLTVKLLKPRDTVRYEPNCISYTEAPETYGDLMRQRIRWYGGTLQTLGKHSSYWWRYGTMSAVMFPYVVLSMFFVPTVEVTALALGLYWALRGLWMGLAGVIALSLAYEFFSSWAAIYLDRDDMRLIWLTIPYVIFYRYLIAIARFRAYYAAYRQRVRWTRAARYGKLEQKIEIKSR
jgi:cellulose synthase/poly-beta-1,6-N-acetylglucosamine synthase-like glycosyltransferase